MRRAGLTPAPAPAAQTWDTANASVAQPTAGRRNAWRSLASAQCSQSAQQSSHGCAINRPETREDSGCNRATVQRALPQNVPTHRSCCVFLVTGSLLITRKERHSLGSSAPGGSLLGACSQCAVGPTSCARPQAQCVAGAAPAAECRRALAYARAPMQACCTGWLQGLSTERADYVSAHPLQERADTRSAEPCDACVQQAAPTPQAPQHGGCRVRNKLERLELQSRGLYKHTSLGSRSNRATSGCITDCLLCTVGRDVRDAGVNLPSMFPA